MVVFAGDTLFFKDFDLQRTSWFVGFDGMLSYGFESLKRVGLRS